MPLSPDPLAFPQACQLVRTSSPCVCMCILCSLFAHVLAIYLRSFRSLFHVPLCSPGGAAGRQRSHGAAGCGGEGAAGTVHGSKQGQPVSQG